MPSLTETVASCAPGLLVGATNWCTHPADLAVTRIGGTKNPDVGQTVALRPDVVLANEEENRQPDLDALRAAGLRGLGHQDPGPARGACLAAADDHAGLPPAGPGLAGRGRVGLAAAARQRRRGRGSADLAPAMDGAWRDTFAGDLLARLGVTNVYAGHPDRYPRVDIDELQARRADMVVLPDEPYRFTASDGPEAFPGSRTALVSGRHLTWYGPSLTEAPAVLRRQLAAARVR